MGIMGRTKSRDLSVSLNPNLVPCTLQTDDEETVSCVWICSPTSVLSAERLPSEEFTIRGLRYNCFNIDNSMVHIR